ncbi:MAG: phospholipid carrier-dependent glycosyltransferase [Anaerolineae bacterium]
MSAGTAPARNLAFWGSVLALIVLSYLWRLSVLDVFPLNYDEGIHLILARLWAADYTPYEEIFVSYPPIFMWTLGVPWRLFQQAGALQLLMATYAISGVLGVVYLGCVYHSRLAGLAAGALLSFTPAYFQPSIAIMGEVPAIGLAVVAVALAEKYRRGGSWRWAALTGAALAFGLSLKLLPFYAVPLVGLMVISRHTAGRGLHVSPVLLRDLAILGASFLAVFLLPFFFFDLTDLYDQVVGMRLVSREAELNPFKSNNETITSFVFGNPGLTALAIFGLVFVMARRIRRYGWLVAWFGLVWASMYIHVPLRSKHLPIFLPPLAVFAGFALSYILEYLRTARQHPFTLRATTMVLAILVVLGMFAWEAPGVIAGNNGRNLNVTENVERLRAIEFIDKIATPDDCVIADNPVFLYSTHRLPPPQLSETSQTRIDTGYLTLQDVVSAIEAYQCHVVAVVTPRFGESIPGLPEWLADRYLGLYPQDDTFVYFGLKGADGRHSPLSGGDFGGVVRLYGLQLDAGPGQESRAISLFWQLTAPLEDSYIERVTLRDPASDEEIFQMSRPPFEGMFHPEAWPVGERVRDTFWLNLPPDLPAGEYDLYLSLCILGSEQCLPVANEPGQTALFIAQLQKH